MFAPVPLERLFGDIQEGRGHVPACVVNSHRERCELFRRRHEAGRICGLGGIADDACCGCAARLQFLDDDIDLAFAAPGNDDGKSTTREPPGDRSTQALRSAHADNQHAASARTRIRGHTVLLRFATYDMIGVILRLARDGAHISHYWPEADRTAKGVSTRDPSEKPSVMRTLPPGLMSAEGSMHIR